MNMNDLEHKRDYIRALIEDAESDKKSVFLYIAFEIGVIAFALKELYQGNNYQQWFVILALVALLFSVWLFFLYFRALHRARLEITICLRDLDADHAHEILKDEKHGVWKTHGKKYDWARALLFVGVLLCISSILIGKLC